VPLEKNATSAQCLECHAEKAKCKFVQHAPAAMKCALTRM
jgi:hypothetical protein